MADTDPQEIIKSEVQGVIATTQSLEDMEKQLSENPAFRTFLQKQKEAQSQIAATWKNIEQQMIEHNVKSVKGEWGSITIAERISFDIDEDVLPAKFFKKVVDTTKISATYKLEGKAPKGTSPKWTKYLTKRLK